MSEYFLYHMPGACSRVALNALEEVGKPYGEQGVGLLRGEQREPAFLAVNPKGKIPVLLADGAAVTEMPTILYRLACDNPDARLLPSGKDGRPTLDSLSDLIWFAGALHPLASRIFRPAMAPGDPATVKEAAIAQLKPLAAICAGRLGKGGWLYEEWSIADTFLAWIFALAGDNGFPMADFPALVAHRKQSEQRPAFGRTISVERAAVARDKLPLPPGGDL